MAPRSPDKVHNEKERRFVDLYMIDSNAEGSAKKAGYAVTTSRTQAHTWVSNTVHNRKPHVAAEIARRQEALAKATQTEAERVREELASIGFHQMRNVTRVDEHGHPVIDYATCEPEDLDNLAEISNETVRARSGEFDEDGMPIYHTVKKVKIKQQDKLAALKELARINGLYERDNNQKGGVIADAITEIQKRMVGAPIRRDEPEGLE